MEMSRFFVQNDNNNNKSIFVQIAEQDECRRVGHFKSLFKVSRNSINLPTAE